MQEEQEPANLKTIVEQYLAEENFSNYPALDLYIKNNDTVVDSYNNVTYTINLWNSLGKKLEVDLDSDIDEQGNYKVENFAGTHIRLLKWELRTQKIRNNIRLDFRCKELM